MIESNQSDADARGKTAEIYYSHFPSKRWVTALRSDNVPLSAFARGKQSMLKWLIKQGYTLIEVKNPQRHFDLAYAEDWKCLEGGLKSHELSEQDRFRSLFQREWESKAKSLKLICPNAFEVRV